MKKLIIALVLTALFLCCTAFASGMVSGVSGSSMLRTGPARSYDAVGTLPVGGSLEYAGSTKYDERGVAWYSVYSGGKVCWVSSKYTTLSGASASSAASGASDADYGYATGDPYGFPAFGGLFRSAEHNYYVNLSDYSSYDGSEVGVFYVTLDGYESRTYAFIGTINFDGSKLTVEKYGYPLGVGTTLVDVGCDYLGCTLDVVDGDNINLMRDGQKIDTLILDRRFSY